MVVLVVHWLLPCLLVTPKLVADLFFPLMNNTGAESVFAMNKMGETAWQVNDSRLIGTLCYYV